MENLVATELEAGAEGDRSDIGNQWDGPTTYASAAQFSRQQPCVFCFMQCSFGLDSEVRVSWRRNEKIHGDKKRKKST